ncbi:MAG: prolyl oligopeptidase family serine peptidase [Lachnospiraceae bacterium]|nr:prolyl oligopeptidase family serine peptidase [Lachnospiraceae bacterium]
MNEIEIREIKIPFKQWETDGILYLPKKESKFPIVVFSHGYNGYKMDFDETAKYLAEYGIASVCCTFCGGSARDVSGMPTTDMTIFSEMENLEAVLAYVKQLEQIDVNNIFTFGGSQGGLVTALTCDNRSDEIKGMMLLFPAFCIPDNWTERYANKADIPEETDFWGMKLGHVFFESIHGYDVFAQVGNYSNNVLVMHGDKDPVVPLEYSEKIKKTYKNIRLEVFEGEGHGFSPEGTRRMTEMVYHFVKANLQ